MSIFDHELSGASVLSIGHRPGLEAFHTRTLHLVRTPDGAMLHHEKPEEWAQGWQNWVGAESGAKASTAVREGSAAAG